MARLIYSNIPGVVDKFISHCESVGFDKYQRIQVSPVCGAIFHKLCIEHTNYKSFGDDFVAIVGTFFYKGRMESEALDLIYRDFEKTRDIVAIRNCMLGHFLLSVKYAETLYVITDAMGIHYCHLYLNSKSGDFIIGNMLYEMALVAPFKCHVHEFNLLEEMHLACVGKDTLLDEFENLTNERYVSIDLKSHELHINTIKVPLLKIDETSNLNQVTKQFSTVLSDSANVLKKNFSQDDIAICMTGGLDARTTLAALLHSEIKPTLLLGIGNSVITNTFTGDLEVDRQIVKMFDLPLHIMDYSSHEDLTTEWGKYIDKYGFLDHFSTITPNLKKSFENMKQRIVLWNMFGELYRNQDYLEHITEQELTVEEIIDKTYAMVTESLQMILKEDYPKYREYVSSKFKTILAPYLNKEGKLPSDLSLIYEYYTHIYYDTHKINVCNQHRYSMSLLCNQNLIPCMMVPLHLRDDAKIQLSVIKNLCPQLLEVPFFSRCRYRIYNKDKNILSLLTTQPAPRYKFVLLQSFHLSNTFLHIWYKKLRKLVKKQTLLQENRLVLTQDYVAENINKQIREVGLFKRTIYPEVSPYIVREAHLLLLSLKKLNVDNITDLYNG